jgi:mRNA interferase MazF
MIRGKIVLLPFPFDDFSALKVRPAVCLTDPVGEHRHIVVAFITSQISTEILDSDLVLTADHAEFARTGLRVNSTLRLHRLMTVTTTLVKRELGELAPSLQTEISARLRRLFAF